MNYAETLTYWYLRLNGFFPLRNFVLHRSDVDCSLKDSADADLLAIRPPHVFEAISGHELTPEPELETQLGFSSGRNIGLIVEVKSGQLKPGALERVIQESRLKAAVLRLGMVPKSQVESVVIPLKTRDLVKGEDWTIAKLLVSKSTRAAGWLNRSVVQLEAFIEQRFKDFELRKCGDRMLFPDELIQFLAWKSAGR